jgi:hypothetical protein
MVLSSANESNISCHHDLLLFYPLCFGTETQAITLFNAKKLYHLTFSALTQIMVTGNVALISRG